MRAIVAIKKANVDGPYDILKHIFTPVIDDGHHNERADVADRVDSVEFYGTNLEHLPSTCRDHLLVYKLIVGGCLKDLEHKYKHIVISAEDAAGDYKPNLRALKKLVRKFVKKELCNSPGTCVAYHIEKEHAHAHIITTNWDTKRRRALRWDKVDLVRLNGLRFDEHAEVLPGAYMHADPVMQNRGRGYMNGDTVVKDLLTLVNDDLAQLEVLEASGVIERYYTKPSVGKNGKQFKGGNLGWKFKGHKIQNRTLQYELARKTKCVNGQPIQIRDEIEQQMCADNDLPLSATLEDYKRAQDLPLYDLNTIDLARIKAEVMPSNRLFKKTARTAFVRRLRYGPADDLGEAIKPFQACLEHVLKGTHTAPLLVPGGFVGFIMQLCVMALSQPRLSKTMPELNMLNKMLCDLEIGDEIKI